MTLILSVRNICEVWCNVHVFVCLFVSKQYILRQRIFTVKAYKRKKLYKEHCSSSEHSSQVFQFLQNQQKNKWWTNIKSTGSLFFQQDGATVYITSNSVTALQNIVVDQIISCLLWPARLPRLTVCDYYLRESLKDNTHKSNPHTQNKLKEIIRLKVWVVSKQELNPLNAELNPICHLLALLGAHHFLHVSRIRVKYSI